MTENKTICPYKFNNGKIDLCNVIKSNDCPKTFDKPTCDLFRAHNKEIETSHFYKVIAHYPNRKNGEFYINAIDLKNANMIFSYYSPKMIIESIEQIMILKDIRKLNEPIIY